MKHLLLTSTALVLSAGVAAAEINFGGSARFGVVYDDSAANEVKLHNRFTLNIDGSVQADTGIEFFARVRVRGENEGISATSPSGVSAPRVGLRVGNFEFATGNIEGAIEEMPGLYDGEIGLTAFNDPTAVAVTNRTGGNYDAFSSAGGGSNGAEVIYSNSGFMGHLSYGSSTELTALVLAYEGSNWFVSGAYQDGPLAIDEKLLLIGGAEFGNFSVGAGYGDNDGTDKWRLHGTVQVGSGTDITAFVADDESGTDTLWGLGFTHSLGGAVLAGAVHGNELGATLADLGVRFQF
ncbi:Porin [Shimia sp. SK013]|uniref:porin n=1 Tax=Shimia sp. SK013 TaxID=1389006 RepID=UPI0006B6599A|nr:porin [Shimia sp. SK013]KPA21187.1 Porin [Shimia sp. SK013]